MTNLQSTRLRTADKLRIVNYSDLLPIVNDLEALLNTLSNESFTVIARISEENNVNIASAPATFDGVTAVVDDKILLAGQTVASQNGLYFFKGAALPMVRTQDELKAGLNVWVTEGLTKADSNWELVTDGTIVVGTTSINFARTSLVMFTMTVAAAQALSAFEPNQIYQLTDATFQGNPQPFITRATDTGDGLLADGYLHIGGIIYPASYDLTTDEVFAFHDLQKNNHISRKLGSGKTCVDNFPIANNSYTNTTGEDFNLTINAGAGSGILNCVIRKDTEITITSAGLVNCDIGPSNTFVLISSIPTGCSFGYDNQITLTSSDLTNSSFGNINNITETNGAIADFWVVDNNTTISNDGTTVSSITAKTGSTLTFLGAASIANNTFGEDSTATIGDVLAVCGLNNSITGSGSTLTLTGGSSLTYFELGQGLTLAITNGNSFSGVRYVRGFSNIPLSLSVSATINVPYDTLVGGPFEVGETITEGVTGATGIVIADSGTVLTLGTVAIGFFLNNNAISGDLSLATAAVNGSATGNSATTITYDNLAAGPFIFGELVTDGTTGATGTVIGDDGTSILILKNVTGLINNNDPLTAAGGTTADANGNALYDIVDLTGFEYVGILNLTSAEANQAIQQIDNANGNHKIRLVPESGLKLTIVDQSLSTGNIYLIGAITSRAVLGTGRGYSELELNGTDMLEYNTVLTY